MDKDTVYIKPSMEVIDVEEENIIVTSK